jgi:hypothetical protein
MEWRRANSKVRQPGVFDRGCFLSGDQACLRDVPITKRQWAKRQSPLRSIRQGDRLRSSAAVYRFVKQPLHRKTQMQRPKGHGGGSGGPPQPAPPQPGPCQPGPPQPANCACWITAGAAGGVGAALATPASPTAEKPSAPAIAPAPTIFFRVMAIPFLLLFTHAVPDALWVDKAHLIWPLSKPCAAAHKCFCRFEHARSQRWSVNADVS